VPGVEEEVGVPKAGGVKLRNHSPHVCMQAFNTTVGQSRHSSPCASGDRGEGMT
jgi:hypothetical protein